MKYERILAPYYPCRHPRTEENTVRVGQGNGLRCKACRRAIAARSREKRRQESAA